MPGMLSAPHSREFKPHILGVTAGGEFCWLIPDFPLLILKFSREKCITPAASALLGKTAHFGAFYKVSVTNQRYRKTWEKKHNAKELQSRENRGKRNQLSGCLETAWVLLEDCFFLCSELFLPPQCNLPSPGTDWTANCTIPAVEDGINISNWYQIHVLQPKSHQILLQTYEHSPGTVPIHTVNCNFWPTEHNITRTDNRMWEQISTVKREFKLEGTSFSEKKKPTQEVDSGSINSFPDVMSLPVGLFLLKRSKRPRAHTLLKFKQ